MYQLLFLIFFRCVPAETAHHLAVPGDRPQHTGLAVTGVLGDGQATSSGDMIRL